MLWAAPLPIVIQHYGSLNCVSRPLAVFAGDEGGEDCGRERFHKGIRVFWIVLNGIIEVIIYHNIYPFNFNFLILIDIY
jgi:hypothetical protein